MTSNFRLADIENTPDFSSDWLFGSPCGPLFPFFPYSRHIFPPSSVTSNCYDASFPSQVPPKPEEIVGEDRKEKMDLIGRKAYILGFCPIKMKAKDTEDLLHLPPYSSKLPIPLFLGGAYLAVSGSLSQDPIVNALFPTPPFKSPGVVGLVGKDGGLITGKELIDHLGVVDIGRGANELGHEFMFRVHGDVVFVAVDGLVSLFGKGGIRVSFSGVSGGFDQTGVSDFAALKLVTLFGKLAFEFFEAGSVEVHGLKIFTEAGDGGVVGNGIGSGEAEESAVEEVAVEHDFHFGVGVAVDLLDDEDFEHEEGIVGRASHGGGMEFGEDFFERFPVDEAIDYG